jgi:dihydroorotate dehydrogenase (fumarate)
MDLTTRYLGMTLKNPLVPSASPLSTSLDTAKRLEDAQASAIVMYSLFEEAVRVEEEAMIRFLHHQDTGFGEAADFLPDHMDFPGELDRYLEQVSALKATLDIPVIASLNGITTGGWVDHAKEIQDAGADALELNVYYVAADITQQGPEIEARYVELLQALKSHISIPINMKLSPAFSAVGNMVKRLEQGGAAGVSLFNRFYQPDIDIHNLQLQPCLYPSSSVETLLPMRWIAILYGRTGLSLGATSGVHNAEDAIKLLLAGADVVHLCSALLSKGPAYLIQVLSGIEEWMESQGFTEISEVRGRLSQLNAADPAQLERTNYIHVIDSYTPGKGVMT